jgi:hypothetical protein
MLAHHPTPLRHARAELRPRAAAAPRVLSSLSLGWTPPSPSFLSFLGARALFPFFFHTAQCRAHPDRTGPELALTATKLLVPPTSRPLPRRLPRSAPPRAGSLNPIATIRVEPPRHFRASPTGNIVRCRSSHPRATECCADRHRVRLTAMAVKPRHGDPSNRAMSASPLVPATPSAILHSSCLGLAVVPVDQQQSSCHGWPPPLDGTSSPCRTPPHPADAALGRLPMQRSTPSSPAKSPSERPTVGAAESSPHGRTDRALPIGEPPSGLRHLHTRHPPPKPASPAARVRPLAPPPLRHNSCPPLFSSWAASPARDGTVVGRFSHQARPAMLGLGRIWPSGR